LQNKLRACSAHDDRGKKRLAEDGISAPHSGKEAALAKLGPGKNAVSGQVSTSPYMDDSPRANLYFDAVETPRGKSPTFMH